MCEQEKDGRDEATPAYIALRGEVFDVSSKPEHYKKGGTYNLFAGHDASYSLATGSLDPADLDKRRGFILVGAFSKRSVRQMSPGRLASLSRRGCVHSYRGMEIFMRNRKVAAWRRCLTTYSQSQNTRVSAPSKEILIEIRCTLFNKIKKCPSSGLVHKIRNACPFRICGIDGGSILYAHCTSRAIHDSVGS